MTLRELLADEDRWELDPGELRELLQQRSEAPFWLIDCREEEEHAAWRIGDDVLMPLSDFPAQVHRRLQSEEASSPIIVYCHHGMRSLQAAQYLRARGFENSFSLRGGIDAWSNSSNEETV